MSKPLLTLLVIGTAGIALSACTNNSPTDLPPGKYEKTSKSVDSSGTAHETSRTTNVEVDEYGNKKATVETEKSTDPEGLFNKRESSSRTTVREN